VELSQDDVKRNVYDFNYFVYKYSENVDRGHLESQLTHFKGVTHNHA
jgi:hypothetical protein